jgi:hypothetical protein
MMQNLGMGGDCRIIPVGIFKGGREREIANWRYSDILGGLLITGKETKDLNVSWI